MGRPKVKDYRTITLSFSIKALEILDQIRGSLSRTEFLERLVLSEGKEKGELLSRIAELEQRVKELEKENERLRELLDARKKIEEEQRINEAIDKRYNELRAEFNNILRGFFVFGDVKAKRLALIELVRKLKSEQGEIDEITKRALERLVQSYGIELNPGTE